MRDDSDVAVVISKEIENGLEGCIAVRVKTPASRATSERRLPR
jgi:hypothetical protein